MTTEKKLLGLVVVFIFLGIIVWSCTRHNFDPDFVELSSCESCHTDYALLQQVYTPDTTAPASGCGGEAPHYEPYDRVFMGGDGFDAYKKSVHYLVGCAGCHKGDEEAATKELAHSGEFTAHPSMFYEETCGNCHSTITDGFTTSLHQGTGQKRKVAMRSGLSGPEDFDQLPAHKIEGYSQNCATCHGSCGNCHVVRPPIGGGGLAKGHDFSAKPDMLNVCVSCHTSRGGHAYLGVAPGTVPDVHLTGMNMKCMNCHTGHELHGNGEPVDHRYAYSELPSCDNCHTGLATSNPYHTKHINTYNCQVCHSQNYNNCGSCHIKGDGARIPAYLGFKIAKNPLPVEKPDYDFALVRRTLAAPDNWKEYVTENYSNFNAFPTYNYATPHNILKKTARTTVPQGKSCYYSCHIRNEGGTLINKELFLFESDLLEWEVDATRPITVDGSLPSSWFN
jgi:thiosulfate/3-mercaptopyruvate sulfurtransferase